MASWVLSILFAFVQASTKFGTELGSNSGVIGYSNNGESPEKHENNYVDGIYTGIKYECVEYARRWLILTQNLTFSGVDCASDIWHLNSVSNSYDSEEFDLNRIPNGSKCKPKAGDVLIYRRAANNPVGHVAIITEVGKSSVKVAEQNWDNDYWPGDYSRELKMKEIKNEYFIIDGSYVVLGWMVYEGSHDKACFDTKCRTCSLPDPKGGCGYL